MQEIKIRAMQPSDLERCAAIEQTALDAWSMQQIADELDFEAARMYVAECGGQVAGFAAFQLAADESTLNTITVDPALRGQGIGKALLENALEQLKEQGAASCFLEVRVQNTPARSLYRSLAFEEAGLRKGFYKNPADDAVVMVKTL